MQNSGMFLGHTPEDDDDDDDDDYDDSCPSLDCCKAPIIAAKEFE
jgi:hypothetical protein